MKPLARFHALALVAALGTAAPATWAQTVPDPQTNAPAMGDSLPARVIPGNGETAAAPSSALLTIDQNRLYLESAWGQRAQAQLEEQGSQIAAENDRLTQLLSSEEAALTARRPDLPAAEFRRLAEDFDLRATAIRRERAQAVQALNAWADADRAAFFRAALPHMGKMMAERG
ncbi:MAG: OmpH family outer membrane protein, partial [Paracoccus sp. (in: a-proteobacteria)]|nr:OmpH family outer membrane protein [Paracoccus sp. (in: a-proteobacteria)]